VPAHDTEQKVVIGEKDFFPLENYKDREETLGYIVLMESRIRQNAVVLRTLRSFKKPVAIADDYGIERGEFPELKAGNVRHFHMTASKHAAKQIGLFLLGLEHRRIAFISPFHGATWSQSRYENLLDCVAAHDTGAEVRLYSFNKYKAVGDYFGHMELRAHFSEFHSFYKTWKHRLPQSYSHWLDQTTGQRLKTLAGKAEISFQMKSLFDSALDNKHISAWVLANDMAGVAAYRYLKKRKIAIPGRISLISFDDSPDALDARLSSYNFNMPSLARGMMGFILNSFFYRGNAGKKPVEVEGHIVERETIKRLSGSDQHSQHKINELSGVKGR
jgi:hypothetical protein